MAIYTQISSTRLRNRNYSIELELQIWAELIGNTALASILLNFLYFKKEILYLLIYSSNRNILLAFSNFIDLSN